MALFIATAAVATVTLKERLNIFAEPSNLATNPPSAPSNEPATLSLPNPSKATGAPKLANWKPRLAAFSVSTDSTATNLMHEIGDILSHFDGMMVFDETAMVDQIADDYINSMGALNPANPTKSISA